MPGTTIRRRRTTKRAKNTKVKKGNHSDAETPARPVAGTKAPGCRDDQSPRTPLQGYLRVSEGIIQECRKIGNQETSWRAQATRDFFSWFPAFLPSLSITCEAVRNSAGSIGVSENDVRWDVVEIDSKNLRTVRNFGTFVL